MALIEIDGLPNLNMVISMAILNNQRVYPYIKDHEYGTLPKNKPPTSPTKTIFDIYIILRQDP